MQWTGDYLWLAVLIPLALWLLTKPGRYESASYRRPSAIQALAWIAVILLLLWAAQRILLPYVTGY